MWLPSLWGGTEPTTSSTDEPHAQWQIFTRRTFNVEKEEWGSKELLCSCRFTAPLFHQGWAHMPASLPAASRLPHPPPREKTTTTTSTTKQMAMQRNINPSPIPELYHEYFTEAWGRKDNKMTFSTILRDIWPCNCYGHIEETRERQRLFERSCVYS